MVHKMLRYKCYYSWNMYIVVITHYKKVGLHGVLCRWSWLCYFTTKNTILCCPGSQEQGNTAFTFQFWHSCIKMRLISLSHCSITLYQVITKRNKYIYITLYIYKITLKVEKSEKVHTNFSFKQYLQSGAKHWQIAEQLQPG